MYEITVEVVGAPGPPGPPGPPGTGGGGGLDQATADARYVNITGDDMTGDLGVDGTVSGNQAWFGDEVELTQVAFHDGGSIFGDFTGEITLGSDMPIKVAGANRVAPQKITNLATPTAASDAVNKQHLEAWTPKIIVLGPVDPVPGGTPAGTVIIRKTA